MVAEEIGAKSRSSSKKKGILRIIKILVPSRLRSLFWNSSTEWLLVNNLLAVFPSHRVRISVLRRLGATLGQDIAIYGGCEFRKPSSLQIADGSSIGHRCLIDARKGLRIGKNVTLGTEVMIWTLQHDYNDAKFGVKGGAVEIGDYAWLGSRSILLPGVKIGRGAVVAAGAVVTKNVDPFTVVGGVPAEIISKRVVQDLKYVPGIDRLHMV